MSEAKLGALPGLGSVIPDVDPDMTSLLGGVRWFDCIDLGATTQIKPMLVGRKIMAVLLRNSSAAAVLPKQLYLLRDDANSVYAFLTEVDALQAVAGEVNVVLADSWLPAAGCPIGDYFWGIVKGPAIAKTPSLEAHFVADFTQGLWLTGSEDNNGRVASSAGDADKTIGRALEVETAANAASQDVDTWVIMNVPCF